MLGRFDLLCGSRTGRFATYKKGSIGGGVQGEQRIGTSFNFVDDSKLFYLQILLSSIS